ncbi:MAG: alpha/beta hydrolase, partial [Geminicoccaceae bacterium]
MSSERLNGHDRPQSNLKALSAALGLPTPDEAYLTAKDGAKLRYAHWQTEAAICQGVVLYLGGRTEFIEKTIDTYALLVESGFDLWSLDWRGQGLSARALADPHKGHVTDYQTYLDDLDLFVREVTDLPARRDKRLMLAHSMGGHIGLRFLHDHPGLIDAAVFSAPMIDIFVNNSLLRWLAYLIRGLGFGERYLPGKGGYRPIYQNSADDRDNGTIEDYQR